MDATPMSSGGRSSDFSIERILSDRPRSEPTEAPSWLCCTRYQPPRLPRATSTQRAVRRRSGRHARVPFTGAQATALEAAFSRAPYLAPPALRALASALHLRDDRIKIWFQNRRARERREKNSHLSPPAAVALPATSTTEPSLNRSRTWAPATTAHNITPSYWRHDTLQNIPRSIPGLSAPQNAQSAIDLDIDEDDGDCSDSSLDVENVND